MRHKVFLTILAILIPMFAQTAPDARANALFFRHLSQSFPLPAADALYEGELIDGAKWTDNNGDNVLIVSGKAIRRGNSGVSTQQVFGYHYATRNGRTELLWKIQDAAENKCGAGKILASPVYVQDINDDGVAETMFVYNAAGSCDAAAPAVYKLMLHSGAQKYAIRGTNAIKNGNTTIGGEKTFDPAFDRAPAEFKNAASEFWDKYVKPAGAN